MAAKQAGQSNGRRCHEMQPERRSERLSMHEGIAPWCDCCVCEAEPYWVDVANEMGINLSDYEDDQQ